MLLQVINCTHGMTNSEACHPKMVNWLKEFRLLAEYSAYTTNVDIILRNMGILRIDHAAS